jgi:peroxiredoxin (alkyl hydroperoxide reductase subunit C)
MPRIGDTAPDFTAVTTHSAAMKFSEWQGDSWVVLFSHPADFTPVCTTEFMEFARREPEFAALNTKLLGLSIDSIHSHVAWMENIRTKLGVEVPFPVIADIDMKVASLYGMLHPGASATATVRAVFFIDPKRVIRAIIYYPLTNGRNIDEVLRLLTALQTSDGKACATPVNWQKGAKVIEPPPKTVADAKSRYTRTDLDMKDFYLSFRQE